MEKDNLEGCLMDFWHLIMIIAIALIFCCIISTIEDTRQRVKHIEQILVETTAKQLKEMK